MDNLGQASQGNTPEPLLPAVAPQDLAQKCMTAINGSLTCLCMTLGHKLGLYATLKSLGQSSSSGLAAAAGLSERWVREWLYQQAAAGFISTDPRAATYWLNDVQTDLLVEAASLKEAKESPLELVLLMPTVLSNVDKITGCFKSGIGLTFDELGTGHMCYAHRHAVACGFSQIPDAVVCLFILQRGLLLEQRLETLPGLTQKLQEGVAVADVGCGSGEVLLHLASVFPNSTFVGYDISQHALSLANKRKSERDLTNVAFLNPHDGPQSRLPCTPTYHLVLVQEALHDMSNPQEMLTFIRQSMITTTSSSSDSTLAPQQNQQPPSTSASNTGTQEQLDALTHYQGGPVLLVADIQSKGDPASNISTMPSASLLYGISVAVCMSSALSEPGGAGLGTVGFHEAVARQMSSSAGFSRFSKLDWDEGIKGFTAHYMFKP